MITRRPPLSLGFGVLVGVGVLALAPPCAAQGDGASSPREATAQALFDEGRRLLAAGNVNDACERFEASQRIDPGTGTELNLADCYEQKGMLATAWATFREAGADARRNGRAEWASLADDRAESLEPRVPKVVVRWTAPATAPGLDVRLDGQSIGLASIGSRVPVDPGKHQVVVSARGFVPFERSLVVAAGEVENVDVPSLERPSALAPAPPPALAARRDLRLPLGIGAAGLGLVGVGLGAYFGLASLAKSSDAAKACPDPAHCPDMTGPNLTADAKTSRTASIVAFSAGGALATTGGALVVLALTQRSRAPVTPTAIVTPDGWRVGAIVHF